jgi:hypothetical protein
VPERNEPLESYGTLAALRWLVDVPLAQQLTSLKLVLDADASFVEAFKLWPKLERISFTGSQRCYRLERKGGELELWIGMRDGRIDGLMARNDYHAAKLRTMIAALRRAGVTSFVLADALKTPLRKALPVLAERIGIPYVPERNEPLESYGTLGTVVHGRAERQQKARSKRRPRT